MEFLVKKLAQLELGSTPQDSGLDGIIREVTTTNSIQEMCEEWFNELLSSTEQQPQQALRWFKELSLLLDVLSGDHAFSQRSTEAVLCLLSLLLQHMTTVITPWYMAAHQDVEEEGVGAGTKRPPASTAAAPPTRKRRKSKAAASSAPEGEEREVVHAVDAEWSLHHTHILQQWLLVALFLKAFSAAEVRPSHALPLCRIMESFFALLLPLLYFYSSDEAKKEAAMKEADAVSHERTDAAVELLCEELRQLRRMTVKWLERCLVGGPRSTVFYAALRALRVYMDTLLFLLSTYPSSSSISESEAKTRPHVVAQTMEQSLPELSGDLLHMLVLATTQWRRMVAGGEAGLFAKHQSTQMLQPSLASPLLLSTLLSEGERLLWRCHNLFTICRPREPHGTVFHILEAVVHRLMGEVLEACHIQGLPLRLANESTATSSTSALLASSPPDPLTTFPVQRGIQSILSLVLLLQFFPPEILAVKLGGPRSGATSSTTPTLWAAAAAAVASFGGPLPLQRFHTRRLTPSRAGMWCADQLRPCRAVLEPLRSQGHHADATGGGDMEEKEGGHGAMLTTAFGTFTPSELTELVLDSLSRIPLVDVAKVEALHKAGLTEMQRVAAQKAQREELDRRREIARENFEATAPTRLLERINPNINRTEGLQKLRSAVSRARFEHAAFLSVLSSYPRLDASRLVQLTWKKADGGIHSSSLYVESEGHSRAKQALLARCLVQMPHSFLDSAIDALLLRLREELEALQREVPPPSSLPSPSATIVSEAGEAQAKEKQQKAIRAFKSELMQRWRSAYDSVYALIMATLFMSFAAHAPTRRRFEHLSTPSPGVGSESMGALDGLASEERETTILRTSKEEKLSINTAQPLGFLVEAKLDGEATGAEETEDLSGFGRTSSAYTQDLSSAVGHAYSSSNNSNNNNPTSSSASMPSSFFSDDSPRQPSVYSHLLSRVLEEVFVTDRVLLLHVLLDVPAITRYIWFYLYTTFALSPIEERCQVGIALLMDLAVRRNSCRSQALQLLFHLCSSSNLLARRLSLQKTGKLLLAIDPHTQKSLIEPGAVQLLVNHAKLEVAGISTYRLSEGPSTTEKKLNAMEALRGITREEAMSAIPAAELASYKKEVERLTRQLHIRLGLFTMMCTREPIALLPSILDAYRQCVHSDNALMARLLLENEDFIRMIQYLPYSPSLFFLLRRYHVEAPRLVQRLLVAIVEPVRQKAESWKRSSLAAHDPARVSGVQQLRDITAAVLAACSGMWANSEIDVRVEEDELARGNGGEGRAKPVLRDFRFLLPCLSHFSAVELRETYLPQFLFFVQTQLEMQRGLGFAGPTAGHSVTAYEAGIRAPETLLTTAERQYIMSSLELRQFIAQVLKEIFIRHPIALTQLSGPRMKRVELLVYLHNISAETKVQAMGGGAKDNAVREAAPSTPPISAITTREVIQSCFELTVRLPGTEASSEIELPLFGLEEALVVMEKLMQQNRNALGTFLPQTQLLSTLLHAAPRLMALAEGTDVNFIGSVQQLVLEPLVQQVVWEKNVILWKGVLRFVDAYYAQCGELIKRLPDEVAKKSLKDFPSLANKFWREHENNASFQHLR